MIVDMVASFGQPGPEWTGNRRTHRRGRRLPERYRVRPLVPNSGADGRADRRFQVRDRHVLDRPASPRRGRPAHVGAPAGLPRIEARVKNADERSSESVEASLEDSTDQLDRFIFGDPRWFERRTPLDDARVLALVAHADRAYEVLHG